MVEKWKPVVGFETHYAVSNLGRVKRIAGGRASRSGRLLKPCIDGHGYPRVGLCIHNKSTTICVHVLVARAFLGLPGKLQVNHKDGNKLNPIADNLEYVTARANIEHATRTGLKKTKVQMDQIEEIKIAYASGEAQTSIAKRYGMTSKGISCIVTGRNWAWLS